MLKIISHGRNENPVHEATSHLGGCSQHAGEGAESGTHCTRPETQLGSVDLQTRKGFYELSANIPEVGGPLPLCPLPPQATQGLPKGVEAALHHSSSQQVGGPLFCMRETRLRKFKEFSQNQTGAKCRSQIPTKTFPTRKPEARAPRLCRDCPGGKQRRPADTAASSSEVYPIQKPHRKRK